MSNSILESYKWSAHVCDPLLFDATSACGPQIHWSIPVQSKNKLWTSASKVSWGEGMLTHPCNSNEFFPSSHSSMCRCLIFAKQLMQTHPKVSLCMYATSNDMATQSYTSFDTSKANNKVHQLTRRHRQNDYGSPTEWILMQATCM